MLRLFRYYGFDKDIYLSVKDLRDQTNQKHTEIVVTLFLVVMFFASVMSVFGVIPHAQRYMYFSFLAAAVIFAAVLLLFRNFAGRYPTVLFYLAILMLIVFSIRSSESEPFQVATVFPAFILLCGVAFLDNMPRFSLAMLMAFGLFVRSSYLCKPPSIRRYDLIYGIIFTFVTLFFHYRFQHNRVEQFLAYQKNLEIQRDLEVQSSFDALSGLLVRGRFFSLADSVLRSRDKDDFIALCILDLDSFKQINDRFGHQMGDKAIQVAADSIWAEMNVDFSEKWSFCERAAKGGLSFAGRLGGDEFVIILREKDGMDAVKVKLRKILNRLNATKMGELDGIHASFGVTQIMPEDKDIDVAYARADAALYKAKTSGKNQIMQE